MYLQLVDTCDSGTALYSALTAVFDFCLTLSSADILRKFDDMIEVILPQLPTSFDSIVDAEGKAALIWILGEYGEVRTYSNCPLT